MAANSNESKIGKASDVVTPEAIIGLVHRLAEVDKVDLMQVTVPEIVAEAISDLNEIGSLGRRVLDGNNDASAQFRFQLTEGADIGKYWGGIENALGPEAVNLIRAPKDWGEIYRGDPCGASGFELAQVLRAAVVLDTVEPSTNPTWLTKAREYLQSRLWTVDGYSAAVTSAFSNQDGSSLGIWKGAKVPVSDFFPVPLPDPVGPTIGPTIGPHIDFCADLADMCGAQLEVALMAQAVEAGSNLIGSVEPNCICYADLPHTVFLAKPQYGSFPIQPGAHIGFGGGIDIAPISLTSTEMRFRLPAGTHTGKVYYLGNPTSYSGPSAYEAITEFNRMCGTFMGEISPLTGVFAPTISVVYPPIIVELSGNGTNGEVCVNSGEAVTLRWRAEFSDVGFPRPADDCARIEVTVFDEMGNAVASGAAEGSQTITINSDQTYTARAIAFTGQRQCGEATPVALVARCIIKPISWTPNILTPVFYGFQDFDRSSSAPGSLRVFYPSLDGTPEGAPFVESCGRYPLVLLIHGQCDIIEPEHYKKWHVLQAQLARSGYIVVVPEFGISSPWDNEPAYNLAEEVLKWMRERWAYRNSLVPPPATGIVGHSYGALLGARLAATNAVSAYVSLSGAWNQWPTSPFPYPLGTLTMPSLFAIGNAKYDWEGDILSSDIWNRVSPIKHKLMLVDGTHWGYVRETGCGSRSFTAQEFKPCHRYESIAADFTTTFLSKYMPPESAANVSSRIGNNLIPENASYTPEQQAFLGGHLAGITFLRTPNIGPLFGSIECTITSEWDLGSGLTGYVELPRMFGI